MELLSYHPFTSHAAFLFNPHSLLSIFSWLPASLLSSISPLSILPSILSSISPADLSVLGERLQSHAWLCLPLKAGAACRRPALKRTWQPFAAHTRRDHGVGADTQGPRQSSCQHRTPCGLPLSLIPLSMFLSVSLYMSFQGEREREFTHLLCLLVVCVCVCVSRLLSLQVMGGG